MTKLTALWPYVLLLLMGAGWALTQPLAKMAVMGGHEHFGMIFWQSIIVILVLGALMYQRRRRLSLAPHHLLVYVILALTGTVLPNTASYQAAAHLPSGILSITISAVPLLAFPMALALKVDHFSWRRFCGLGIGMLAVLLIMLPQSSLPDPAMVPWVGVALIAPAFYAMEGNYVAKYGTGGLSPVDALCGASVVAAIVTLPLALMTDQFIDPRGPWDIADQALVGSSLIHAFVYAGYVWLVGRSGATFAAQVAYLVTGFGIFWAILLLQESYSAYVWFALILMLAGMALVQPRSTSKLGNSAKAGDAKASKQ